MSIGEDDNQPVHPTKSRCKDGKGIKLFLGSQKHETASLCIHKKVVLVVRGLRGPPSEKAAPPSEDQRHSKALVPS